MTTNQLFFSIATLMITLFGLAMAFFKYYLDAKIGEVKTYNDGKLDLANTKLDSLAKSIDLLINYMIEHQGKIERLEERTKKL